MTLESNPVGLPAHETVSGSVRLEAVRREFRDAKEMQDLHS